MAERLKHLSRRDRLRPIGRAMGCGGSTATVAPAAVTNLTAGTAAPGSPRDVGRAVLQAGQKRSGVAVLIIDPQNSFHDGGSLAVPGADEDAVRIQKLLAEHSESISSVHVTLDSHQRMHIAHGLFWTDADGKPPDPFTLISTADVEGGKWKAVNSEDQGAALKYVHTLDEHGKFQLCIWPEHCIIGSQGHNVTTPVSEGLDAWAGSKRRSVDWVFKGQNTLTEMYSALKAEVEIAGDPGTLLNSSMIAKLGSKERVLVCGQAQSHCVNFTVRDLVANWPKEDLHRIVLLEDAMSSVPGFEAAGEEFIADMRAAGLTVTTAGKAFE